MTPQTRLLSAPYLRLAPAHEPVGDGSAVPNVPKTKGAPGDVTQLKERAVLVVEDEVILAMDIENALQKVGAKVLGPAPTLKSAMDHATSDSKMDGAILDIDLAGQVVFPAASVLQERGVPFLFHSGHQMDADVVESFPTIPICPKPMKLDRLLSELAAVIGPKPLPQ